MYRAQIKLSFFTGTPVATVSASDADEDKRLHYELINGNIRGRFAITSNNGRGLITVAQPLDYKQEKRYVLTVTATDSGGRSDTATVYVNISDANNFAPVFENAPYSSSVSCRYSYSINFILCCMFFFINHKENHTSL